MQPEQIARAAGEAANRGRWDEAERLWRELHAREPDNAQALFSLGVHALRRGDAAGARDLLGAGAAAAPSDPLMQHTLSVACRRLGDDAGEAAAIDAALVADAYFLPALLAKGARLERVGKPFAAARAYRNALDAAPPEPHWPQALRAELAHARQAAEHGAAAMDARLAAAMEQAGAGLGPAALARWREAAAIVAGKSKPYVSQCNQLYVPRLPAIPFFDRAQFAWAEALERETAAIRAELNTAIEAAPDAFSPYVEIRPGAPVNQWSGLNRSRAWSAFHLWRRGAPVAENLALCPRTGAALARIERAEIGGLCPNAMFSALGPRTQIPPHHGETNARLVAHLPLIVPDGCVFRVGAEQRVWREGELLVFDDSIEHEARNDSDALRVVLIFDVWNPLLDPAERGMVQALVEAARGLADPS